ncbi:hypothetical protein K0M31_012915 [Melipona bicolor]|uniref:Uncharacterized protein n=1 Tax=Melipona bicolor TaxID=60889 RepID=A0AA40FJQ9_9HYME|nr:hypothetical protein K0M31_012915 [Melipona bicolor]
MPVGAQRPCNDNTSGERKRVERQRNGLEKERRNWRNRDGTGWTARVREAAGFPEVKSGQVGRAQERESKNRSAMARPAAVRTQGYQPLSFH